MSHVYRFESFTTSNCYVVTPEKNSNICYLIDLPPDVNEVLNYVNKKNLSIGAVFLTHGHYDHSLGLQTYNDGNVYMSLEDEFLARNPAEQLKSFMIQEEISLDKYQGILKNIEDYDDQNLVVYKNPGHTKGSISFLFKESGIIFTGDFVFAEGVGRTDLYSGDIVQMKHSINNIFVPLNKDYEVFPGHGKSDTVNNILNYNNYLKEFIDD